MRFINKEEKDCYWNSILSGKRKTWRMREHFDNEANMNLVYKDKFIWFCFSEDKIILVNFPFIKNLDFDNIFIPITRQSLIDAILTKFFFKSYFVNSMESFVTFNGL